MVSPQNTEEPKFIESVIKLNDTYLNCSVIITSREINKSVFDEYDVDIFHLKGFDNDLVQRYLCKRFDGDEKAISRAKENIIEIGKNSNITPLIIRLISDLANDTPSKQSNEITEKYFKQDNPLDKIIFQLINREIAKQSLGINCDEYFEILRDIVFEYSGVVTKENFDFIIECILATSVRRTKQDSFNNFYLSILLSNENEIFKIKYDSLEFWIKARNLSYLISEKDDELDKSVLKTIAQDCYKGGVLVKEIGKYKKSNTVYECNLIRNIVSKNDNLDDNSKRKLISALLYIFFEKIHGDKNDNSNTLLDIFSIKKNGKIRGLSIYGDFYPLDFSFFTVVDGYFNDYSNLSKSSMPSEKKVFYSSQFLNISKNEFGKESLTKENFHDDCTLCEEMLSAIELNTEGNENKLGHIKNDLEKIFKVGFKGSAFVWKSEQLYLSKCTSLKTNMSLENYLQILQKEGFLIKESAKSSPDIGYKVSDKYMLDIKEFLSQRLVSNSIDTLTKTIFSK